MFKEDIETCKFIGKLQEKYEYPKYINVTTGKNNKERVLEAARLVNGAIKLSGSVQSLDEEVLESIKRKNISAEKLLEVAKQAQGVNSNIVSEVILGLPTDSKVKHFNTLKQLIDSSFNLIVMYQLMMLPGTEMNVEESREKYGLKTKYRVLPRCFGHFNVLGREITSAEIEEIAIENSTLSFNDYLECRKMNLIINIFYNEGIFEEIVKVLENLGISAFSWLEKIYENKDIARFVDLTDQYINETTNELWESKDKLVEFTKDKGNIEQYIAGDMGNNLLAKYKAMSLTSYFENVCEVARLSIKEVLHDHSVVDSNIEDLMNEIISFKYFRIANIFNLNFSEYCGHEFLYDINSDELDISKRKSSHFNIESIKFDVPVLFDFCFDDDQVAMIKSYLDLFGNDLAGLSKTLSRIYLKQFFRTARKAST